MSIIEFIPYISELALITVYVFIIRGLKTSFDYFGKMLDIQLKILEKHTRLLEESFQILSQLKNTKKQTKESKK